MRRLTLLLALLGALVALSVAGAGQASTVASTLPAFSGATFQLTDPYPRPAVTVGTFTYSVSAGEVIVGATISGYFGNSAVPNSAGVDVRLNGALVGQCVMYDTCYWLGAPWSHTFSASEARSLLGSGSAVLTAVQTSQYTIRLAPTTLTIQTAAPLTVRGSGTLRQPWTTAVSSFTVDVTGATAPKCGDATPATGSMEIEQMRVTYRGMSASLSASMTSPSYVYATQVTQGPSPGPSAVIAGNGSYTITTLRGSFLEKGAGYIKAGIDAGTAGRVSGYVDPDGPQGLVEFPAAGQGTTFTGNVAILNHNCATPGPGPTPGPSS